MKKTILVEVDILSGASDADKLCYYEELFADIKSTVEGFKYHSWRKNIHTNYDESEVVDLDINVKKVENNMENTDKNSDTVTISRKEYESLLGSQELLTALESAGVDNWEGYSFAMEPMKRLKIKKTKKVLDK